MNERYYRLVQHKPPKESISFDPSRHYQISTSSPLSSPYHPPSPPDSPRHHSRPRDGQSR